MKRFILPLLLLTLFLPCLAQAQEYKTVGLKDLTSIVAQNKGKVVSREKLMEALWETNSFVDENTLTVNVGRLRKKLDAAGLKDFIGTKFGVGYIVG